MGDLRRNVKQVERATEQALSSISKAYVTADKQMTRALEKTGAADNPQLAAIRSEYAGTMRQVASTHTQAVQQALVALAAPNRGMLKTWDDQLMSVLSLGLVRRK